MKLELELGDDFIEALASAIASKMPAAPVATEEKTSEKPAGTTAKSDKPKKPVEEAKGPKRADVLEKVKDLGAKTSREAAKEIVGKFAPAFADVKDADLAKLDAALDEALKAAEAPAGDDY